MNKLLTAAAGLLLVFCASGAQADEHTGDRANWMIERLQFSDEQQAEVDAILAETRERREAFMAETAEERKALAERRKALMEQLTAIGKTEQERIAGVLTGEQQALLEQMRERSQGRAAMRMRPGMRGPEMQRFVMGQQRGRRALMQQQLEAARRYLNLREQEEEGAQQRGRRPTQERLEALRRQLEQREQEEEAAEE